MSETEGRTLALAGAALLVVSLVRWGLEARRPPLELPGDTSEVTALLEESRAAQEEAERRKAPLEPGETLDPNRAPEVELDRLPGVGPAVARAVVSTREDVPFRTPEDLLRVRGIGAATLAKIRGHLDMTRPPPGRPRLSGRREGRTVGTRSPVRSILEGEGAAGTPTELPRVDPNRASEAELQTLPGIGPALARRILESRRKEGPFRGPEDLLRVRGIGPATLERIRERLQTGR